MKENIGNGRLQTVALVSILGITRSAHGETSINTISIPGPVLLKVLWVVAAVGLIFFITRSRSGLGTGFNPPMWGGRDSPPPYVGGYDLTGGIGARLAAGEDFGF